MYGGVKKVGGEGRLWGEVEAEMGVGLYLQSLVEAGEKMKLKDSENKVCI